MHERTLLQGVNLAVYHDLTLLFLFIFEIKRFLLHNNYLLLLFLTITLHMVGKRFPLPAWRAAIDECSGHFNKLVMQK